MSTVSSTSLEGIDENLFDVITTSWKKNAKTGATS